MCTTKPISIPGEDYPIYVSFQYPPVYNDTKLRISVEASASNCIMHVLLNNWFFFFLVVQVPGSSSTIFGLQVYSIPATYNQAELLSFLALLIPADASGFSIYRSLSLLISL